MRFLLVGMGKSNKSAYRALIKRGHYVDCLVDDEFKENTYKYIDEKNVNINSYDYIIRSPGINVFHRFYKLINKHKNVISEIELAYMFSNKKGYYIGITGSNGKTTTVRLLEQILSRKYKVIMAGNIGFPLCDYIEEINDDTIVLLELSSFQLEMLKYLHLSIAVITSLCPNHLDSVISIEDYYKSKFNITNNQNEKDIFIFDRKYNEYLTNSIVNVIDLAKLNKSFSSKLKGDFNNKNINIAYYISLYLNVDDSIILNEIEKFRPLKFRMEEIEKINNTIFINDSKSTTVDSTLACYNTYKGNKLLICGGKDKNIDFNRLNKIKNILVYGEIKNKVNGIRKNKLSDFYNYIKTNYNKYDYIIFSPATSSYDQYKSYIERGEDYNNLIGRLKNEEIKA